MTNDFFEYQVSSIIYRLSFQNLAAIYLGGTMEKTESNLRQIFIKNPQERFCER